jgi:hypothetical protein
MTFIEMKKKTSQVGVWAKQTIMVLLVLEVFIAHMLAYLYITNFRVELVPVQKVQAISPIQK